MSGPVSTLVHDGWIHRPVPLAGAELRTWTTRIEQTRAVRSETHVSLRAPYDSALRRAYEAHTVEAARQSSEELAALLESVAPAVPARPVAPVAETAPAPQAGALVLAVQHGVTNRRRAA